MNEAQVRTVEQVLQVLEEHTRLRRACTPFCIKSKAEAANPAPIHW